MDSGASSSSLVAPEPLKHGPQWFRDWTNGLLDYVIRTTPLAGPNIQASQASNGLMLSGTPGGGGTITIIGTKDGVPHYITVTGTIGEEIPPPP